MTCHGFGDYLGICSGDQGLIDFFNAEEDDYMYWRTGTGTDYGIFANQRVFVRSSEACNCNFIGVFTEYATTTLDSIMRMNPADLFLYAGQSWTSQGLSQNLFYLKNDTIPVSAYSGMYDDTLNPLIIGKDNYFTYNYNLYKMDYDVDEIVTFEQTDNINMAAELLMKFGNDNTSYKAINGTLFWSHLNGIFQKALTGRTLISDSAVPLAGDYTSDTLALEDGDILFVDTTFTYNGVKAAPSTISIVQYNTDGTFTVLINQWSSTGLTTIFNIVENSDAYSAVATSATLTEVDPSKSIKSVIEPDVMFAETNMSNDKKYYLEINEREV